MGNKNINDANSSSNRNESAKSEKKEKKSPMSSVGDVLSFIVTRRNRALFCVGCIFGVGNGLVYPMLTYFLSTAFSEISGVADNGLQQVREVSYAFLVFGAYAFICAALQTGCLEIVAARATRAFRTQWFAALLRQDAAFFDVTDIAGTASTIGPNSRKMRRGLGRKLGEGVQYSTTFVAGIAFAFYSSWKVSLVVLGVMPLVSVSALTILKVNESKSARASASYSTAGQVAYSTVSAIRTVLSLNAIPEMIRQYSEATLEAYKFATRGLWREGIANGSLTGSFIALFCILTLFGSYVIYREIRESGCDASAAIDGNTSCDPSGPEVYRAMLCVAFAAQSLSQVANCIEVFTAARVACYPAMLAINRKVGAEEQETSIDVAIPSDQKEESADNGVQDLEGGSPVRKAVLPKYVIDSSSSEGLKLAEVVGSISFKNVCFSYPTRPNNLIFSDFSFDIEPGSTVALVGPSGGGKSTTVALIERFYDPTSGSVTLDGVDLRELNVKNLRSHIGYVGQEPALFATTIARNIQYGLPDATQEQIEAAARMANAHDFIASFPDGYNTNVGDKGAKLSGGQKQRIAIARALVSNPKILILDEATSALDSESELVVQEALDKLLVGHKRTTIVIAHRLSTIRTADVIAVIDGGKVVEMGNHEELMEAATGHYRRLVEKQQQDPTNAKAMPTNNIVSISQGESTSSLNKEIQADVRAGDSVTSYQLRFRDVRFAYPSRPEKEVFKGFNLNVRRGETLALVGPSGGGKSTVVSLIERFYDPNQGVIEYQGEDLRTLNVKWLRDQIGYVGQEPTLFSTTIGRNIVYGVPGATQNQIEEAAIMANAHDFIISFPDGYDTEVGEGGAQLSGGQKQRVAIARALVRSPKVLLLDEATSALDSESEAVVQEAIDKLIDSRDSTVIVIAHRLSTIRKVDRIAFVDEGVVKEIGSHDELIEKPNGRYKRLVESQKRGSIALVPTLLEEEQTMKNSETDEQKDETEDFEGAADEKARQAFDAKRVRELAKPDVKFLLVGAIGATFAGGIYPAWGVLFGLMIKLLFQRVYPCGDSTQGFDPLVEFGFDNCDEYFDWTADDMQRTSYKLAGAWAAVTASCLIGNMLLYWGFGMASERMNKRIRDSAFKALVRQEVAFFDQHSVGSITSQLQDDAAKIHAITGEPIRSSVTKMSSVIAGAIVSLVFMWPFALVAIAMIPIMGIAARGRAKAFLGQDAGDDEKEGDNSPGGIVVETLLNMKTVSALSLEEQRYEDYVEALWTDEPDPIKDSLQAGATSGLSFLIQQWVNAFQFWWGGWLLFNHSNIFSYEDFLISMFALLFALFGMGAASINASDRKECEESAQRIFRILNRQSAIDPLSEDGKKLD